MKRVVAALIAGGMVAAAHAAQRAESAMECGIAADMAIVADSLAKEQIQQPKAEAIMVRIYDVSQSDRGRELMRDIMDAAYSAQRNASASSGGTGSEPTFAENLFSTCMRTGGDMDNILGRRS